eukprot:366354-Chlamydomonas_euryale.AAC.9
MYRPAFLNPSTSPLPLPPTFKPQRTLHVAVRRQLQALGCAACHDAPPGGLRRADKCLSQQARVHLRCRRRPCELLPHTHIHSGPRTHVHSELRTHIHTEPHHVVQCPGQLQACDTLPRPSARFATSFPGHLHIAQHPPRPTARSRPATPEGPP